MGGIGCQDGIFSCFPKGAALVWLRFSLAFTECRHERRRIM